MTRRFFSGDAFYLFCCGNDLQ